MAPAMLHLGLRDWGAAEWLAGLGAMAGLMNRQQSQSAVADWFSSAFGRPAFVLDSGRHALQLALACLHAERPECDEVVLPALACPALTESVLNSGLLPRYVDIAGDLNTPAANLIAVLGPRTLAVVMVHAYGLAADTEAITALCRRTGIALIDDAAQRIDPLSRLGSHGEFGVFSFAQSKSVVAGIDGSGGVLLVNAPRHLPAIDSRYGSLGIARGRVWPWLEFAATPHWPRLAYRIARWRPALGPEGRPPARIAGLDAAIVRRQLASLPERSARRIQQLQWYGRHLSEAGVAAPQLGHSDPPEFLARILVQVSADGRAACRQWLLRAGIATRLPYALPVGLTATTHPNAARAAEELLELPLSPMLRESDVRRVVDALTDFTAPRNIPLRHSHPACTTIGN